MYSQVLMVVTLLVGVVALPTGSASAAPPVIDSFTGTADGNVVTLSWQTTGGECSGGYCLLYIYGNARYDANGWARGDAGFLPQDGSVSFRVPAGGAHTFTLRVRNGLDFTHQTVVVDVAAPAVPTPTTDPVVVDMLDERELAPGDVAATVAWSHPGSGYVQVQAPGQSGFSSTQHPATGSLDVTAAQLRSYNGTAWGPHEHRFDVRYCELPAVSTPVTRGPANLPICSAAARVTLVEHTSPFDTARVTVPSGTGATVTWADDADHWFVSAPTLGISSWVNNPSVAISPSAPDGVHNVHLVACREVEPGTDSCTNNFRFESPADGTVVDVIEPSLFIPAGTVVARVDSTGDGVADHDLVTPQAGSMIASQIAVAEGQPVDEGQVILRIVTRFPANQVFPGAPGWADGNRTTMQVAVGDDATWTTADWSAGFSSGPADWQPLWKHDTAGIPLDVTVDANGDTWSIGEYNQVLGHVTAGGELRAHEIPVLRYADNTWNSNWSPGWPAGLYKKTSPFGSNFSPYDQLSPISAWGESITLDDDGVVYAAQGGSPYNALDGNHSRIVRYDPSVSDSAATLHDDAMCMVNMPETRNSVSGLAWDDTRGRLWVAEYRRGNNTSVISSFDPDELPCENDLNWADPNSVAASAHQYCVGGATEGCLSKKTLAGFRHIAHLTVAPDGDVWFTEYEGALGRFDPDTGETWRYPLPTPSKPNLAFGSGAWQVRVEGDHVYLNEFFDSDLVRFDMTREDDPECLEEVGAQDTPCVEELHVPLQSATQTIHSIEIDDDRLWFTIGGGGVAPGTGGLGVVDLGDWAAGTPTGTIYTGVDDLAPAGRAGVASTEFTGIAVDPTNGDLVLADFIRRQIIRLDPN